VLVLLRGLVKVTLDTDDGHEILLSVLRPGDLIGEFEAIDHDDGPRTASNIALDVVFTRVMTGDEFRFYLETHPGAALAVLRAIIRRLRVADQRRIDSGSRDTVGRLAHLLVELADEHGRSTSTGVDIDIPLTQQELASLIGSSRESIVRSLRVLRSHQLVTTGRRRITIRDLGGLRLEVDGQ
jgi:CRP/FNR family transcriptional regulator, cyclic AMP receptor protein